jgi:thiol-disulfide isomerase/thioredoxin
MNKFSRKFILLLVTLFCLFNHCDLYADSHGVPIVGKRCPDFALTNLVNSKKPRITLKDFKGKWLMIDIWESGCVVCIHKFPAVSRLQNQFKNQLSVLLIGINDVQYNKDIKQLYQKLEKRLHFQLLAAFDTVVSKQWEVYSVPHIVLVNPQGLVYAVTNGLDMDSVKIGELLAGKKPQFMSKDHLMSFDEKKPLLIRNNGGLDTSFLYRSVLSRYVDEDYFTPPDVNYYLENNKAGFQVISAPLYRLYYYAYFGQWIWGRVKDSLFDKVSSILELDIKDSTLFKADFVNRKNLFNYSLYLPPGKKNAHTIMQALQRELINCFGFDATIETRNVPCWTLTVRKDTTVSLRSGGGTVEVFDSPLQVKLKNGSVEQLLLTIGSIHQDKTPFIDETGIDYPIDIEVDALMLDLPEVQRALYRNGLELLKKERPMKVIVIRDPMAQ